TLQEAGSHVPEGAEILHHDGEDRAELNDDIELRPLRRVVPEQLGSEDQVPGRRHGQEFGEPLDDAENDGGKSQVHVAVVMAERAAKSTARSRYHQMLTRSSGGR